MNNRVNIFLLSVLFGLIVGSVVNFYRISQPIADVSFSERGITVLSLNPELTKEEQITMSYWRGKVDTKLNSIDKKMDEFQSQIKELNCNLSEVKIAAAKEGSIYGAITSLIVFLASLLGQNILRRNKKIS